MSDDFRGWLADELTRRNWSASDLARRMGMSTGTVSNVRTGMYNPTFEFCARLALAFGYKEQYVLERAGLIAPSTPFGQTVRAIADEVADWPVEHQELLWEITQTLGRRLRETPAAPEPDNDAGEQS